MQIVGSRTHPYRTAAVLREGHGHEHMMPLLDLQTAVAVAAFQHLIVDRRHPYRPVAVGQQTVDIYPAMFLAGKQLAQGDVVEPLPPEVVHVQTVQERGYPQIRLRIGRDRDHRPVLQAGA